jgi:UDP-GlcNAc:undecaprenyl-phosphate/decaprenyl-phosphate GlcNAc-1-phosphate transferase
MNLAALLVAVILGVPLTWVALRFGTLVGLMDRPGVIKIHSAPITHTGGASILATLLLGSLFVSVPLGLIVGASLTWAVGFVDDVRGLSAGSKLAALIVPLGIAVVSLDLTWPERLLAIGAGLVLLNAFNVTDGLDGLAAGIALPPLLVLSSEPRIGVVAALVSGAAVAFLLFNLPPARIFLGDEGSLLLGFFLWALPLTLMAEQTEAWNVGSSLLLWGFPLANLAFVTASRILRRRPILVGDRSHLYDVLHRRLGLKAALTLCWSLAALCAVLATIGTPSTG